MSKKRLTVSDLQKRRGIIPQEKKIDVKENEKVENSQVKVLETIMNKNENKKDEKEITEKKNIQKEKIEAKKKKKDMTKTTFRFDLETSDLWSKYVIKQLRKDYKVPKFQTVMGKAFKDYLRKNI